MYLNTYNVHHSPCGVSTAIILASTKAALKSKIKPKLYTQIIQGFHKTKVHEIKQFNSAFEIHI